MYKKIICGWLALVGACGWLCAQEPAAGLPLSIGSLPIGSLSIRVSTGYQQEDLHWSIAGNSAGQDPNIYSELKWRHVSGPLLRVGADWNPAGRWRVWAEGSRVFTRSGKVSDTDYGGDNRTNAVYQQGFDSHQGYSYSVSAGVGYRVLDAALLRLTPYIGYAVSGQSFSILDPGGIYGFLNSHYIARWKGPLLKVDAAGRLAGRWEWEAALVYHQVQYSAKADWNLISSFSHPVSFRHAADGYGVDAEAAVRYRAGRRVVLRAGGGFFTWQTGKGTDDLYLSAGGTDHTQMNGVGRDGWKAEVGVVWSFGS